MRPRVERLRACALVAIACAFADVCVANTLLTGDLGRWLDVKAVPALVQSLANHPRFRGETVRVVALRDGTPMPTAERLTQELQRELTHQLSAQNAVRIALPDTPKPCELPEGRPFLLGVEVAGLPGNHYRVNIAMIDRDEGVWVNGLNLRWEGTLTRRQRTALSQPVNPVALGSPGQPIPVADRAAVVDSLASQMECVLRSGVSGRLAIKPTDHATLAPIVRELGARAAALPGVALTPVTDDPDWLLTADLGGALDRGSAELFLSLAPSEGDAPPQRVASIWVSQPVAPARPAVVSSTPARAAVASATPPSPPARATVVPSGPPSRPVIPAPSVMPSRVAPTAHTGSLITPLRAMASPPTGICVRSDAGGRCVDVELRLAFDAYLFVFHTDQRHVHPHACGHRLLTANAGPHRYRLTLDRPYPDPINLYAVATRERDLAHLLNAVLQAGPGACGARTADAPEAWLGRFRTLVHRYGLRVHWQSVHLSPDIQVLALRPGE